MDNADRAGLSRRWRELPQAVRAAFLCCFAAGFFTHIFAFTNIIPNADGISRVADPQQMTVSGRWFLHYATAWNGFVQAPAVIGFFSLLFLSLAAALVASMLRLRSGILGGLTGALMVVFPSVAYTFLYLFTASAYCFGILLAVLAVWLVNRYKFGFLIAVPLLACSVGTYQAYIAVAASLSLICVVLFALEGEHSAGEILLTGLRHLVFLILSLAVYYAVLRIFLRVKDLTLLNYKGIDSFGGDLNLKSLLPLAGSAYSTFVDYFFVPHSFAHYTTPIAVLGNGLLGLMTLWAFVRIAVRNGCVKRPVALALTLLLCGLLPLALNLTVLMGKAMPIMRYALVFAYVLALALVDRAAAAGGAAAASAAPSRSARAGGVLRGAAACVSVLLLVVSLNIDNLAYTVSATAHRATESFATRLVERVETTPGYVNGMPVILIGGFPQDVYHSQIEVFSLVTDYSNVADTVIPLNKQVYYYLNDWLNVTWQEPDAAVMQAISDSEFFKSMPLYPSDGSVVIRDGRVIVKLAKAYKPKKDYEIAYENRR